MSKKKIELPKLPRGEGSLSWDSKTDGLIIYKKSFRIGERSVRLYATGYSITECFDIMKEKERQASNSYYANLDAYNEYSKMLLGDGIATFLSNEKTNLKPKSYDRLEQICENQIKKYTISKIETYNITEDMLIRHLRAIADKHSISTLKKTYSLLRQYFNFVYSKTPQKNPTFLVTLPQEKPRVLDVQDVMSGTDKKQVLSNGTHVITEKEILSDSQIDIFKKEATKPYNIGVSGYRYGCGLYFIMMTFMRMGDSLGLKWSDIDFDKKVVSVYVDVSTVKNRDYDKDSDDPEKRKKTKRVISTTKYDNERKVMLTDEVIDVLQEHRRRMFPYNKNDDFIFTTIHGTLASDRVLYDSLKLIMRRCGLDKEVVKFSPHSLRHTGISYYIRHGVPIDVIAKQAGHSVDVCKKVYYHIIKDQEDVALNLMNAITR